MINEKVSVKDFKELEERVGKIGEIINGVDLGVTSIPSGTFTKLKSITLTPGLWIVQGFAFIQRTSGTEAQRYRALAICSPTGNPIIYANQTSDESNSDFVNIMHILRVRTEDTYYLSARQTSSAAITINASASTVNAYRLA